MRWALDLERLGARLAGFERDGAQMRLWLDDLVEAPVEARITPDGEGEALELFPDRSSRHRALLARLA